MQRSDRFSRTALIAAAVFSAFSSVSAQEAAVKDQPSIYDTWPKADVAKPAPNAGIEQLEQAKRLTEIFGQSINPLYDKDGKFAKQIIPKFDTGAIYEDENGNKMTARQKAEREMIRREAFRILQQNGYSWKEHKKRLEEKKKEPDEWAVKTEETKKWIKEHGPITSKVFIRPGTTPEQSAALDDPNNAYRYIDGRWVVVDGKTKRPILEGPRASGVVKRVREATPLVTVTTKAVKRPARSSDLENYTPPVTYTRPVTPDLVEDIAEGKYSDKPNLTAEEVQKLFPDLNLKELETKGKARSVERINIEDSNKAAAEKAKGKEGAVNDVKPAGRPISFLDGISGVLTEVFGIASAHAQTMKSDDTDSGYGRRENISLDIPENKYLKELGGEYAKYAQDMDKAARKIQDAVKKNVETTASGQADGKKQAGYLDQVLEASKAGLATGKSDELTAQAAQFAAEIVHKTGSLTKAEYEDDIRMLTNMMTDKKTGSAIVAELRRILKNHPEIYNLDPQADKELDKLAWEKFGIGQPPAETNAETTYVFLSRSMGMQAIKDIMERASFAARHDLVLVFRGVPEGKNINEGVLEIQMLGKSLRPMPNTVVDPALFKRYNVTAVPTVVRAKGRSVVAETLDQSEAGLVPGTPAEMKGRKFGSMIARVEGLDNDEWLMSRIEQGQKGDLGVQGDVVEISEPDLIEVMKKKFMEVNWEEKKRLAIKNAWKHQNFIDLPTAGKARTREVDPTILVEKDIRDLAGRPIRKAGDRVNPLQIQPFTLTLVIFDPLKEDEMRRVGQFISRNKMMGKPNPVLIATRIDKEKGWDSYKALTDRMQEHVYVLNTDVQERFEIEATPSVVTADNTKHVFVVQELGPIDPVKTEKAAHTQGGKY